MVENNVDLKKKQIRDEVAFFRYKKKIAKYLTKSLYYKFICKKTKSLYYFKKLSELNRYYKTNSIKDDINDFSIDVNISIDSLFVSLYYAIESYDMVVVHQIMDELSSNDIKKSMDESRLNTFELLKVRIEILKHEIENLK